MLMRLAELVPADFMIKTLALTATGLIVITCVYLELFGGPNEAAPLTLLLALLYPVLFLAAYLYLTILYPLRESVSFPQTRQHPTLLLLSILNYLCAIALLQQGMPYSNAPHVILFLLALPAAATSGLLLWQAAIIIVSANLIAGFLLLPAVSALFFLQILSSQLLVYLLFNSLINEFRQKTIANINLAQLHATQRLLEARVELETRESIARDLHDELGHLSTVISNNLNQYCHINSNRDPLLINAMDLTRKMSGQIRHLSHTWQQPSFDIKAALAMLAENIPRPDIFIDLEGFDGLCSATCGETLFRCCQELITNSMKHSNASRLYIMIIKSPTQFSVSVEDNGSNNGHLVPGSGLSGIHSRVTKLGGNSDLKLTPDGFRAQLTIPAL